jgi:hypothetical protein
VNSATPAVSAAQAIADWQSERRSPNADPRDVLAIRYAGDGGDTTGAGALPRNARVLDTALDALLDALRTDPVGERLRGQMILAAQRGAALRAEVLGTSPDGLVRLSVGAARFGLALPGGPQAGETIFLRLVRGSAAGTGIPTARERAPGSGSESASAGQAADLGYTARLISRLLVAGHAPRPITSPQPLSTTPGNATGISTGLREAIRFSGLFYESHLADWVTGTGSKAALRREPQATLLEACAPGTEPAAARTLLPAQAEALVQRQLDLLENNVAAWKGQVWPGQEAELNIEPESRNRTTSGERGWEATVRLSFPGLGDIEARIGLRGRSATIRLRARTSQAADTLRARREEYSRALGAQGLILSEASVSHA